MMKPKAITEHEDGMLEFLEDIIGSNRFRKSIETLSQRIEVLNDFRAEKVCYGILVTGVLGVFYVHICI